MKWSKIRFVKGLDTQIYIASLSQLLGLWECSFAQKKTRKLQQRSDEFSNKLVEEKFLIFVTN